MASMIGKGTSFTRAESHAKSTPAFAAEVDDACPTRLFPQPFSDANQDPKSFRHQPWAFRAPITQAGILTIDDRSFARVAIANRLRATLCPLWCMVLVLFLANG